MFSGEIDFSNDLQPGDSFRLVVERATRDDGVFAGYGPILAAEFVNAGKPLQALRFAPPEGKPGYYDAAGRSLRRFFLKSPLKFEPRDHLDVFPSPASSSAELHTRAQRS